MGEEIHGSTTAVIGAPGAIPRDLDKHLRALGLTR